MATFKFTGTITVTNVRSKEDAINTLQIMLDDFEDMNESDTSVIIQWDGVEKVNQR